MDFYSASSIGDCDFSEVIDFFFFLQLFSKFSTRARIIFKSGFYF